PSPLIVTDSFGGGRPTSVSSNAICVGVMITLELMPLQASDAEPELTLPLNVSVPPCCPSVVGVHVTKKSADEPGPIAKLFPGGGETANALPTIDHDTESDALPLFLTVTFEDVLVVLIGTSRKSIVVGATAMPLLPE